MKNPIPARNRRASGEAADASKKKGVKARPLETSGRGSQGRRRRRRPEAVRPGGLRGGMYSSVLMTRSGPSNRDVTITGSAALRTERTMARSCSLVKGTGPSSSDDENKVTRRARLIASSTSPTPTAVESAGGSGSAIRSSTGGSCRPGSRTKSGIESSASAPKSGRSSLEDDGTPCDRELDFTYCQMLWIGVLGVIRQPPSEPPFPSHRAPAAGHQRTSLRLAPEAAGAPRSADATVAAPSPAA